MGNIARLIIGDNNCLLYDGDGAELVLHTPRDLPEGLPKACEIDLNLSELDVARIAIPMMGTWDRHRFAKQRNMNQKPSLLMGTKIFKDCLIEISCPATQMIQDWLDALQRAGKNITCINPLFIPIQAKDTDNILVISHCHTQGFRQTAYMNNRPIFTRLTNNGVLMDELRATLTYLKNQFQIKNIQVECHLSPHDFNGIQAIANDHITLTLLSPTDRATPYQFTLPQKVQDYKRQNQLKLLNRYGTIATTVLFCISGWQYFNLNRALQTETDLRATALGLDEQVKLVRTSLPLEKRLPLHYQTGLKQVSPIAIFQDIAQALTSDITLSAMKWENTATEERILLEVKFLNQDDEADQNIDATQDFKANLLEILPDFVAQTQSLPHGSSALETFSGSAEGQDMTLDGDRGKATILLIRKKQS